MSCHHPGNDNTESMVRAGYKHFEKISIPKIVIGFGVGVFGLGFGFYHLGLTIFEMVIIRSDSMRGCLPGILGRQKSCDESDQFEGRLQGDGS